MARPWGRCDGWIAVEGVGDIFFHAAFHGAFPWRRWTMVIAPSMNCGWGRCLDCEYQGNPGRLLANQKYMREFYCSYSDLVHVDP